MFGGQKIRPWVSAWMCWRTRKVTGWVLSDNPNSNTILAALRHALMDDSNMGGPRCVWIDNGKDWSSWLFHGSTKTQRREKIDLRIDEAKTYGIFNMLNVKAHFSLPFNGNGKARLERWFRTLTPFCRSFATYTGLSIETKPERLNEILASPRLIPSFKEVETRLANHIAGDNANPDHDIDDLVENGERLSSAEAFRRWCDTRLVMADPKALDLLLAHWHRPVPVTKQGITINVMGQPISYGNMAPELSRFKALRRQDRKPVLVTYDPHNLNTVKVH
jgi:transposase InsO family protein